jgi:hypothetical protein
MRHDLFRPIRPFLEPILAKVARFLAPASTVPIRAAITIWLSFNVAGVGPIVAFALAGGGHGIYSPVWVSWAFLIGAVGLPAWWFLRRRRLGTVLALALLANWLLADGLLAYWTFYETYQFMRVWRLHSGVIVAWFVMWLIPQASLLWLLIRPPQKTASATATQVRQRTSPVA